MITRLKVQETRFSWRFRGLCDLKLKKQKIHPTSPMQKLQ